jgi:hypothetical protein
VIVSPACIVSGEDEGRLASSNAPLPHLSRLQWCHDLLSASASLALLIRTASCPSPASTSLSIVSGAGTVSLCPPQLFPCLFSDERWCLIRLVYLQLSIVDHREQLRRQVTLTSFEKRNETMRSPPHRGRSRAARPRPCPVRSIRSSLDFSAGHCTSRVRGLAVMPDMARLVGQCILWREARKTSMTL